ncbi:3'-5' exonuclease [Mangrovibacterium lignilyticum]|uniref:3'-5' exonuclease n=1 Tax=Mangrovibacterium lignilyticum TaxID=2668052 RepID=UPI0013D25FD5|nr:3'-5' exonuclease [Mangrovibacterium lignilyticum]
MNNYILFIDIETSDMPKRWNAPTAKVDEWPFILQIAWVVCKKGGELIAKRDFYVKQKDIPIGEVASRLHGITVDVLEEKGEERRVVLNTLAADLELYKPMIVGHFLEFDKRMLEVGFSREDIVRNFDQLPRFCTMLYTRKPKDIFGGGSYMRLNELYQSLFGEKLSDQHNALADAEATKDCFFELVKRGEVTDQTIAKQKRITGRRWELPIWMVVLFSILIGGGLFYLLVFLI